MSNNDTSGPAFPAPQNGPDGHTQYGMSLRDWFAGKALLAGMLAYPEWGTVPPKSIAISCYAMADAMMEARKKSL